MDESAKSTEPPPVEDIDAFSELTPQDVLEVVESVTKDLMSGLQVGSTRPSQMTANHAWPKLYIRKTQTKPNQKKSKKQKKYKNNTAVDRKYLIIK